MINMRNEDSSQEQAFRAVSISRDGISNWSTPSLARALPDPISFASLHRFDSRTILFSNAASRLKLNFWPRLFGIRGPREPMAIRASYDDGKSWSHFRIYEREEGAYSDIAVRGTLVYILYEQGWRKENKYFAKYLKLARFNMRWLEGREKKL